MLEEDLLTILEKMCYNKIEKVKQMKNDTPNS